MVEDLVDSGQKRAIAIAEMKAIQNAFDQVPTEDWMEKRFAEHKAADEVRGARLEQSISALMQQGFAQQNDKLSQFSVDMRKDFNRLESKFTTLGFIVSSAVIATGTLALAVMNLH